MITIPPQMESKRSMYAFALTNAATIREWVANGAVAPKGESPYQATRFATRKKRNEQKRKDTLSFIGDGNDLGQQNS